MTLMAILTVSAAALALSACADASGGETARLRHMHTAWGQHTLVPAAAATPAETPKLVHDHTPAGHTLKDNAEPASGD